MEIDKNRQAQALAKAKSLLSDAEKNREAARVEKNFQLFMQGNFDTLTNDEFVENLPSYILNKYIQDEKQEAVEHLLKIGESLCSSDEETRERSLMVLSVFCEIIIEENIRDFQETVSIILVEWLRIEEEFIAGFEFVCSQLQKIILLMLANEQWHELQSQIHILHEITTGEIEKNNLIRGVSAKIHENLAEPDILDRLVTVYLDENDDRHAVARDILIHLGRFAAMFLVQKMIYSNNREDRFALVDIIPRVGAVSIPVLSDCLEDKPQWFVIRNIILIISRIGDTELFHMVESYLTYPDIRVQQQVINCIEILGGTEMRKRMIMALMAVNDDLKGQIVNQLGQFSDSDVGEAFVELLSKREDISRHIREDLVLKLSVRLQHYPSMAAVSCLQELVEQRIEQFDDNDRVAQEAVAVLQKIEILLEDQGSDTDKPESVKQRNESISNHELSEADILAQISDDEENELFNREEMDDMAMDETLVAPFNDSSADDEDPSHTETGDIAPSTSQDQHLNIWSKLYEDMSSEEANEFFAVLEPVTYDAGETIIRRSDADTSIYLIDRGFATLSYTDSDHEIEFSSLQSGDFIGCEGFIHNLQWTLSLSAQTDLQVRLLDQERFSTLTGQFPQLLQKLQDYCNYYDVIPSLVKLTENRDEEPVGSDVSISGVSLFHDSAGEQLEGTVQGTVEYATHGGYCFTLPFVHPENTEAALGRQVSSRVMLTDGPDKKCFGVIAGAGNHPLDEQTTIIYVKFYHPLENAAYHCTGIEIM